MPRLLAELERRAQTQADTFDIDQVVHIIVIAVVLAVITHAVEAHEHGRKGKLH